MKILISEVKARGEEVKVRRKDGDISELKKSIQEYGLINPITINQNHELLAGRRRFQAVKELGWEETDVRVINSQLPPAKAGGLSLPNPTGDGRDVWQVDDCPTTNVDRSDGISHSGEMAEYTGE